MQYLVTAGEMKRYDEYTSKKIGIPSLVLMERAALSVFERVEEACSERCFRSKNAFIMAGVGNNGADGLAIGRLLTDAGYVVEIRIIGEESKASSEWKIQRSILENYSVLWSNKPSKTEYDVIIDALFGVGLNRFAEGKFKEAIQSLNDLRGYKVAVDIASGINADNGSVMGVAFKADETVTFGFKKCGQVMYPGCEYTGKLMVGSIGITERCFAEGKPQMFFLDEAWDAIMPKREASGNKGTFGKVLLIAGSENMAGAAVLAAKAAYRIGSGMVKIISSWENRCVIQSTVPEALFGTEENLKDSLPWADVIVVGPGLGMSETAKDMLEYSLKYSKLPILIDADGLNILSVNAELMEVLIQEGLEGRSIVLTPHMGELSRLTGKTIQEVKKDTLKICRRLTKEIHCVVAAKDARTFIFKENEPCCINVTGNNGMATAGSGDVLAGVIAGFMAQGMDAFEAACAGCYIHGNTGDKLAKEIGQHAIMAGDIADSLLEEKE